MYIYLILIHIVNWELWSKKTKNEIKSKTTAAVSASAADIYAIVDSRP